MASPDSPRPTDPAAAEPFFTVLRRDEFRMANLTPQARQRFLASGEADVKALLSFIHSRIDPDFTPASVLEYGCGPGRLALPLARRYASVVAVDSSEPTAHEPRGEQLRRSTSASGNCASMFSILQVQSQLAGPLAERWVSG